MSYTVVGKNLYRRHQWLCIWNFGVIFLTSVVPPSTLIMYCTVAATPFIIFIVQSGELHEKSVPTPVNPPIVSGYSSLALPTLN